MNRQQVAIVLCIVGWAILCILPDNVNATDKFFQTGGRFGKRRENRYTGDRFTDLMKPPTMENVPPRIERGFYISRYGKRNSNLFSDNEYFTLCLSSYGMSCDYIGLSNLLRCKRIRPLDCSTENLVDDKVSLKSDNTMQNFKND
ncbi:uncharacterized protein LOC126844651 [Adelges cooleyi]|uniref:uncharacterized protein LOC126844651 n=1 Tax=Adelges cooleyi TaxID=133065 RepID=UPI00217F5463|nr:uncharacterized protein LOC126844651 [Adelges cooleyi]